MVAPIQAVLRYVATPVGSTTLAKLLTVMGNVVLPISDLTNIGVSLISDVTSAFGSDAQRVITLSLKPIFTSFPVPAKTSCRGSISSSSANDTFDGTGVRQLSLRYLNRDNLIKEFKFNMLGQKSVNFMPQDIVTPQSLSIVASGSLGTNDGLISMRAGIDNTGPMVDQILGNFQGSIVSTSAGDSGGGIGARTITITYMDRAGGGPFVETVTLNKQTPVNLVGIDHAVITNMVIATKGSAGSSLGTITIMSGLKGTGTPVAQLGQPFFSFFPFGTDQKAPFRGIYTSILGSVLISKIIADGPVLS